MYIYVYLFIYSSLLIILNQFNSRIQFAIVNSIQFDDSVQFGKPELCAAARHVRYASAFRVAKRTESPDCIESSN